MKKIYFFMLFLLIPAVGFADNTSWIKGGGSWGDLSNCSADAEGNQVCDDDIDTEDEFFFQVSPLNVRKKINKSKFGVRFEPWMGYSEQSVSLQQARAGGVIEDPNAPAIEEVIAVEAVEEIVAVEAVEEVIAVEGVAGVEAADRIANISVGDIIQPAITAGDVIVPAIVAGVTEIEPAILLGAELQPQITLNQVLIAEVFEVIDNTDPLNPITITLGEPAVLAGVDDVQEQIFAGIFDERNAVLATVDVPAVIAPTDLPLILATEPSLSVPAVEAVIEVIAVPGVDAVAAVIGVPGVVGIAGIAAQDAGTLTLNQITQLDDLKFKNIQIGMNMFLDYTVAKNFEVYGGPFVGFEVSKIAYRQEETSSPTPIDGNPDAPGVSSQTQGSTKFDSGVFWGGEVGAEMKVFDVVAIGGFMQVLKHEGDIYTDLGISDQGTETRVGAGLTYYW